MAEEAGELKLVFMGTPAFAVASLDALVKAGFNIAAVVTAPDKPAGRGMKLQESDVKKYAVAHGIRVLQPQKLKSPEFVDELQQINADLQVVVAFRMLPEVVWSLPRLGTINLHASLLPQYRGAAPINHALMQGEKETGVTTFKLKHEIDTGNILLQERVVVDDDDNAASLHDKLMQAGSDLLVKTVEGLRDGTLSEKQQEDLSATEIKHAPKIFREDCEIDWHQAAHTIRNFIRGLSPRPGAFTFLKNKRIIITRAAVEMQQPKINPGDYITDGRTYLKIAAADGFLQVLKLKPEGKGQMAVEDFLRGRRDL